MVGGHLFLASLFDKVARLRAYEFIAERLRRGTFPVGVAEFLRAVFFVEHLVAASELFVMLFEFRYFAFHYLTFDINITYFFMIQTKICKSIFSLNS